MPRKKNEYRFRIDAYSPTRMPLDVLAEYLKDIAILLGEEKSLHLIRIDKGSTMPVIRIDNEAIPKINERAEQVKQKEAPAESMEAAERIEKRLKRDNAKFGEFIAPDDTKILEFRVPKQQKVIEYGPFTQHGTFEGIPIKIGGENDLVPIHLEGKQQETIICQANRTIAKEIAVHLFSTMIRVEGNGRWKRHGNGDWEMLKFTIRDFTPLSGMSLADELEELRAIDANWKKLNDPLGDLDIIRHDNEIQ